MSSMEKDSIITTKVAELSDLPLTVGLGRNWGGAMVKGKTGSWTRILLCCLILCFLGEDISSLSGSSGLPFSWCLPSRRMDKIRGWG